MSGAPQRYSPYPAGYRGPRRPFFPAVTPAAGHSGSRSVALAAPRLSGSAASNGVLRPIPLYWSRLPWPLLRALADAGFSTAALIEQAVAASIRDRLPPSIVAQFSDLIEEIARPGRQRLFDVFLEITRHVSLRCALHLHTFGNVSYDVLALRRGHLTPARNMEVLRLLGAQGHSLQAVCDSIADARAGPGV